MARQANKKDGKFEIDFFELLFLAEVCIPPVPIARACFFDSLSEVHYHKMSKEQRLRFYEFLKPKLNIDNEDHKLFLCRFNPENQYQITTGYLGEVEFHNSFLMDEKYHTSKNKFIAPDYIIDILPII